MNKKKQIIKYSIISAIVVVCVLLDQVTKFIAESKLVKYQSVEVIEGFFDLTLCYNTGGAWSILNDSTWILILVSIVALGFMIFTFIKSEDRMYLVSASVFTGGLIGNLIDRIFNIGVVDFFDFNIFGYDFPVFNVADIFIVCSAIFIGISLLLEDKKDKIKNKDEENESNSSN